MDKKITILSIDGGGIRGILPGVIVAYLESQLQIRTKNPHARISDYFDMIAGTSTGGILTCLYVAPGADGRPKYSAQDALDLYLKNGQRIFTIPWHRRLFNAFGLFISKYPVKNIECVLKKYFGDLKLSQATKPCMVTSYEIFQRKTMFFNKLDTTKSDTRDFYLRDIARATSAAPTYFRPVTIHSTFGNPLYLSDGGLFANNPAMCAYAEARSTRFTDALQRTDKPDFPDASQMIMVSIGTGSQGKPYPYSRARKWGVIAWLKPLIDILMSSNSETVHYELRHMFSAIDPKNRANYFRLEPTIGTADSSIDLATPVNMLALQEAGKTFVADHVPELYRIVDLLIENK